MNPFTRRKVRSPREPPANYGYLPGTNPPHYPQHPYSNNQYYTSHPSYPPHLSAPQYMYHPPEPPYREASRSKARSRADSRPTLLRTPDELLEGFDHHAGTGLLWDMRFPPNTSRHPGDKDRKVARVRIQKAATEPITRKMRITFPNKSDWEIDVTSQNEREYFSVEDVLVSIYEYLHHPIGQEDWDELSPDRQRQVHLLRHDRLADAAVVFNADSAIRYVDLLGWKTAFAGLTPLGPTEWGIAIVDRRNVPELKKRGVHEYIFVKIFFLTKFLQETTDNGWSIIH